MATKKTLTQDQESLADALFRVEVEEFEEAILSIPPEKRILRTEQYDFSVATLVGMMEKGVRKSGRVATKAELEAIQSGTGFWSGLRRWLS